MIVRQFLHWVRTAQAGERAEATNALARAYLISDMSADDRAAAEGAMIMLLDDPSPLVRGALADVLAASYEAPPAVIYALANDQPDVAVQVLKHSPLFIDADLVDMVATGEPAVQATIASRRHLPRAVSAAVAEVGSAESCLVLIENQYADIAPFSLDRIVERFGHLAAVREALFDRDDLSTASRHVLVSKLSETLADFVSARQWLDPERAQRVAKDACERAVVVLAATTGGDDLGALVRHLRETAQLNAGLILRALLSGNTALFEAALADLAGLPVARVASILHDAGAPFRALYEKAGLPASTWPAFREAVEALREAAHLDEPGGASRLKRRMIERVLTRSNDATLGDVEPFMTLLRRFATEAAREEARRYCDELVADDDSRFDVSAEDRVAA